MAKYNFNLRNNKSESLTPINLIIRWDNKRLVYPTELRAIPNNSKNPTPNKWNSKKQQVENISLPRGITIKELSENNQVLHNSIERVNISLSNLQSNVKKAFDKFKIINNRSPYSVKELREVLNQEFNPTAPEESMEFFKYFQKWIDGVSHIKTKQWYENTYRKIKDFDKKLDFHDIDLMFYNGFIGYLEGKNYAKNTIAKHIQNLKSVLNAATEDGKNTNLIFRSKKFKKETEESDSIALKDNELNEIFDIDLSNNPKLDRVRDLFIVGCRTGLRFSDYQYINSESFKNGFIYLRDDKNHTAVVIPLDEQVILIRKKYQGKTDNALPRPISNQKFNDYVKEVCKLIPSMHEIEVIKKTVGGKSVTEKKPRYELCSSHTARRTFATINYKRGIPIYSIMAVTGHKTEKSFLKYVKITAEEHAQTMAMHWKKIKE